MGETVMNIVRKLVLTAALAATAVIPASAQDVNAVPNYATLTLRTGFTPDPVRVNVASGGNVNAERMGSACTGFISAAPDGRFYCDDDGGANGLNPGIRFDNALSGRYEIWVGTYGSTNNHPARVEISELTTQ